MNIGDKFSFTSCVNFYFGERGTFRAQIGRRKWTAPAVITKKTREIRLDLNGDPLWRYEGAIGKWEEDSPTPDYVDPL